MTEYEVVVPFISNMERATEIKNRLEKEMNIIVFIRDVDEKKKSEIILDSSTERMDNPMNRYSRE